MYERRKGERRKRVGHPPVVFVDANGNRTVNERRKLPDRRSVTSDSGYLAQSAIDRS